LTIAEFPEQWEWPLLAPHWRLADKSNGSSLLPSAPVFPKNLVLRREKILRLGLRLVHPTH